MPAPAAMDEDTPATPQTAYGRSKLSGTERIRDIARRCGRDAVVLRVFNAIGAGMSTSSVIGGALGTSRRAATNAGPR